MIYRDKFNKGRFECFLVDRGTMDTHIRVNGWETAFDGEYASGFRKRDGSFGKAGFRALCQEAIEAYQENQVYEEAENEKGKV